MKYALCIGLALLLSCGQGLLRAEGEKKEAGPPVLPAPELPKAEDIKDAPGAGGGAKADVEVPEGEPEPSQTSVKVIQARPGHFRWGNFLLGALGGAAIVTVYGIVSGSTNASSGQIDGSKIALWAGSGAVSGGLLSVLLGATSPLPATPPDLSGLPQAPRQFALNLKF